MHSHKGAGFLIYHMLFNDLGLSEALLKAISKQGYSHPSPIQEKAIPQILVGKDTLASVQTGTGKTARFTLPMLQLRSETTKPRRIPQRFGFNAHT